MRTRLYPDIPARRRATLLHDLWALVAFGFLVWLGIFVHDSVDRMSVLGRGIANVGSALPPLIGGPVVDFGERGVSHVHTVANVLGVLTFAVPAVLALWIYLPRRIAQVRNLTAAARILAGPVSAEQRRALAMRAALSLPYGQLVHFTRDPLGDLAAERYDGLIAAALDDAGIAIPGSPERRT